MVRGVTLAVDVSSIGPLPTADPMRLRQVVDGVHPFDVDAVIVAAAKIGGGNAGVDLRFGRTEPAPLLELPER